MGGLLLSTPEAPKRVLIVGLGGGTIPMALREILPQAQVDVVEIDPAVTKVARDYFGFRADTEAEGVRDGRPRVREARHPRRQEVRRHPAGCLRPGLHPRAPADARSSSRRRSPCSLPAACWWATPSRPASCTTTSPPPMRRCSTSSTTSSRPTASSWRGPRACRPPEQLRTRALQYELSLRGFGVDIQSVLPIVHHHAGLGHQGARADGSVFAGEPAEPLGRLAGVRVGLQGRRLSSLYSASGLALYSSRSTSRPMVPLNSSRSAPCC